MNAQHLRIMQETVRQDFNLAGVAGALKMRHADVVEHIADLEDELGCALFNQLEGGLIELTRAGQDFVSIAAQILLVQQAVRRTDPETARRDTGDLVIASTHAQFHTALPRVIEEFARAYPNVRLSMHEASPSDIMSMLLAGRADIGIAIEGLPDSGDLASFPYDTWHHCLIVPVGHSLEQAATLTLEAIAEFPIVTYHKGSNGRGRIDEAFADAGLSPRIARTGADAAAIKFLVERGVGVGLGIVAAMAFDAARDRHLRRLDAAHLFKINTSLIAVRRGAYLSGFAHRFIEMCEPDLTVAKVKAGRRPFRGL